MEFGRMVNALKDKSVLITGSTGFLAKIFVEKVLRVQPDVKRLYLLVRAADTKSAVQRFQREVIQKELFHLLRDKHGKEFHSFVSEKVSPIAGDIIKENLGIEDTNLRELLWNDINMVINVAATTNFYDRYDVALKVNVLGAKNVINFAKRCKNLEVFLHVSTAFVTGEKQGILLEKAFGMGETLKDNLYLDIEAEIKLMERRKTELQLEKSTMDVEKMAMKALGIERARHFGWLNTYVFTKAMGEMLLGQLRGSLPLIIARPTIITSIWMDPLPGWIEGNRTIDSVIIGYANGNLPCIVADTESTMDVVLWSELFALFPNNAMIAMVATHSNQNGEFIYHISSSVRNLAKYSILEHSMYRYFAEYPQIGRNGKAIKLSKIHAFRTLASFYVFLFLRFRLPLEMLRLVNIIMYCMFSKKYKELSGKYKFVIRLIDLYAPYCFFKGCFDDNNLERLRMATKKYSDYHMFDFDPKNINWDDYFYKIHIPGVLKYVCK